MTPHGGVQGGTQAGAIPQAAGGVPGTGAPGDTENDPRVIFSNVSRLLRFLGDIGFGTPLEGKDRGSKTEPRRA